MYCARALVAILVGFVLQYCLLLLFLAKHGIFTLFPYYILGSPNGTIPYTGEVSSLEEFIGGLIIFCLPYFFTVLVVIIITRLHPVEEAMLTIGTSILGSFVLQAGLQLFSTNIIFSNLINILLGFYGEFFTVVLPQIPLLFCFALIGRLAYKK